MNNGRTNTQTSAESLKNGPDFLPLKLIMTRAIVCQQFGAIERILEQKAKLVKRLYSLDNISKKQLQLAQITESDIKEISAFKKVTWLYIEQTENKILEMHLKIADMISMDTQIFSAIDTMKNGEH